MQKPINNDYFRSIFTTKQVYYLSDSFTRDPIYNALVKMKVLELFAGSRSFSKVAEQRGHKVFTSDYKDFEGIDYVCDILDFDISKVPFEPDVIWASPPCTYFSVASIGHHWNKDHTPKTNEAILGVEIVQKTLDIINELNPSVYFIENPRGKLRKLDVVRNLQRATICYCKYGEDRMKPTDIWSNFINTAFSYGWQPRPMCFNGNPHCHHQYAPRGSKTGTQGIKGNYLRSIVPEELCREIIESVEKCTTFELTH